MGTAAAAAAEAAEPYSEPMVVQQLSVILECARDAEGEPTTYGLLIRRVAGRQAIVVESVDAHSPNFSRLLKGDEILSVQGVAVAGDYAQFIAVLQANKGSAIPLELAREMTASAAAALAAPAPAASPASPGKLMDFRRVSASPEVLGTTPPRDERPTLQQPTPLRLAATPVPHLSISTSRLFDRDSPNYNPSRTSSRHAASSPTISSPPGTNANPASASRLSTTNRRFSCGSEANSAYSAYSAAAYAAADAAASRKPGVPDAISLHLPRGVPTPSFLRQVPESARTAATYPTRLFDRESRRVDGARTSRDKMIAMHFPNPTATSPTHYDGPKRAVHEYPVLKTGRWVESNSTFQMSLHPDEPAKAGGMFTVDYCRPRAPSPAPPSRKHADTLEVSKMSLEQLEEQGAVVVECLTPRASTPIKKGGAVAAAAFFEQFAKQQ